MRRRITACILLMALLMASALVPSAFADDYAEPGYYTPTEVKVGVSGSGTFYLREIDASTGSEVAGGENNADLNLGSKEPWSQGYGEFTLRFGEPGEYLYTIYKAEESDGVRYNIRVDVTTGVENEEDILRAAVSIMRDGEDEKVSIAFFPVLVVDPPVKKIVEGKDVPKDTEFIFIFEAYDTTVESFKGNMPMPEGSVGQKKELKIVGSGEVEAGVIELPKPGRYIYHVTEKNTGEEGYTYDRSLYEIVYDVTETSTGLAVSRTITVNDKAATEVVFTNKYTKDGPIKTGDEANLNQWLVIMGASVLVALVVVLVLLKGRDKKRPAADNVQ